VAPELVSGVDDPAHTLRVALSDTATGRSAFAGSSASQTSSASKSNVEQTAERFPFGHTPVRG
jgi:hypothetical protein